MKLKEDICKFIAGNIILKNHSIHHQTNLTSVSKRDIIKNQLQILYY